MTTATDLTTRFPSPMIPAHLIEQVQSNDTFGLLLDVRVLVDEARVRCERANAQGGYTGNPAAELDEVLTLVNRALDKL